MSKSGEILGKGSLSGKVVKIAEVGPQGVAALDTYGQVALFSID